MESIPTRNATNKVIINFIQENILSRFGCPRKLVTDNAKYFQSKWNFSKAFYTYYPQGNGLVESTNKNIIQSIRKLLIQNKRYWDSMLKYALWVDRITTKKAIGSSPFQLVYGTHVVFPIQLGIPVIKFFQDSQEEPNDIQRRIFSLNESQ